MKMNKKRIPFGSERRILQADARRCASCRRRSGKLHEPGCAEEECPECGKSLVGCCCEILSPYDSEKIIQGLYDQFDSLESALSATGEEGCSDSGASSYLQHAVMRYIFNHVPDQARRQIEEAFHLRFPGLVPHLLDDEGRAYYTAEQLAKALGMPLQEVHERIDAMVTSGQSIKISDSRTLRRVH